MYRLRWLLAVVLVSVLLVLAAGIWLQKQWLQPLTTGNDVVTFEVRSGESLRRVLNRAEASGWLRNARWVGLVAAYRRLDSGLQVGEYRVTSGMTAADLLVAISSGRVVTRNITFPEGITLAEARRMLCLRDELVCTLSGPDDPQLVALVGGQPEGWFLPDTYQYRRGDSDLDILSQSHLLMRRFLEEAWPARSVDLPLSNPYDALTLASIIERETGQPDERGRIAGVFTRRLAMGMRLQTDPTVIYGLGPSYNGNLTRAHLRDDENPYNTYRIKGLPPTPIALPGREAILAALHPEAGDDLYFVARGDGSHAFAATLAEHRENVSRYQLQRRTDYRSSPQ